MNHSLGSCLKTVLDFSHFSLDSGMFFKETEGNVHMYVWTYLSFPFQMNKKEREICEFEMGFKKSFLLAF